MYSSGPLHMDEQRQDVQFEPTYSTSVPIRDVTLSISRKQWTIGRCDERWSGISMLVAWHDNDDDDKLKNPIGLWPYFLKGFMTKNFWLDIFVWFYDISIIVGYLMPNPFLYIQTVLFQTIQFSISTLFSSIWLIDRTLSGATTPGQSGTPHSSKLQHFWSLTVRLLSVISGHSLGDSYSSAKMQSVYSTAPADWAISKWSRNIEKTVYLIRNCINL